MYFILSSKSLLLTVLGCKESIRSAGKNAAANKDSDGVGVKEPVKGPSGRIELWFNFVFLL